MYFAIYVGCNKDIPLIYAIAETENDIYKIINDNLGDDKLVDFYIDDDTDDIPYVVSNVPYEHIKSIMPNYNQMKNMFKDCNNIGLNYIGCNDLLSIFKTNDPSINLAKVISSLLIF
jgi:hypothetical protein